MVNIASRIIQKFGGAPIVARVVQTDRTAVYKWTYPKERGGADGLIPSRYHGLLLQAAKEQGIDLTPDDFFALNESGGGHD